MAIAAKKATARKATRKRVAKKAPAKKTTAKRLRPARPPLARRRPRRRRRARRRPRRSPTVVRPRRPPARKTTAKKTTARKTTAKKVAKRRPAKKTAARKTHRLARPLPSGLRLARPRPGRPRLARPPQEDYASQDGGQEGLVHRNALSSTARVETGGALRGPPVSRRELGQIVGIVDVEGEVVPLEHLDCEPWRVHSSRCARRSRGRTASRRPPSSARGAGSCHGGVDPARRSRRRTRASVPIPEHRAGRRARR